MADLIHVICFRVPEWMRDELKALAKLNRRKLGDVVRILVEQALEFKRAQKGGPRL